MTPPFEILQTDLQDVQAGDWFLPMTLKGVNQHELIQQAFTKGAIGFTFEEGQSFPENLGPHFGIPDLRAYLFSRALEKRREVSAKIAVITGSAGKTSVKEILGSILNETATTGFHLSPENKNTKIALATQILRLPFVKKLAVFEMGARRKDDFVLPLSFLQPSVVVLLNIGRAHIGEFGSLENLRQEKLSVLDSPSAQILVVSGDDPEILTRARKTGKKVLSFGQEAHNSIQILQENHHSVVLKIFGQEKEFFCGWSGSGKPANLAAAVGASIAMDIPEEKVLEGLKKFRGAPRRFQSFRWDQTLAIDDAYNASPESMTLGLQHLHHLHPGHKTLLVLGSMLELGEDSQKLHEEVALEIAKIWGPLDHSSLAIATVGPEARFLGQKACELGLPVRHYRHFAEAKDAVLFLREWKKSFEVVFFKGSKSVDLKSIFAETL